MRERETVFSDVNWIFIFFFQNFCWLVWVTIFCRINTCKFFSYWHWFLRSTFWCLLTSVELLVEIFLHLISLIFSPTESKNKNCNNQVLKKKITRQISVNMVMRWVTAWHFFFLICFLIYMYLYLLSYFLGSLLIRSPA